MVNLPEIHKQQPRMMPKHQCRCGVLFRSIQAIKRFKNRLVDAKRSIFGTGFPSFSSHHPFEAQAAVVNDQHDVDDNMLDNSMRDNDLTEFEDIWNMLEDLEEQPATLSPSPAVTLIPAEESSDHTHSPHNQTSSLSSDLIEHPSSPDNKWTLSDLVLSEVNCLPALSFPDIPDEPVEGVMSTTTLAATTTTTTTTTTTRSYNTHIYGSETAPQVYSTTTYNGMMYSEYVTGPSAQKYDLLSQILMRDEGFQSSQIIAPPSPRRWCVLKLIVWACKHLRISRLTFLDTQIPVTTACQQRHKRRLEDFEGTRSRKKGSGKNWVVEIRLSTKTYGPNAGKVWLGSFATREQAARAYDVGKMFCSKAARSFNFPESQSILAPCKNKFSQLSIPEKKKTIQMIARQYGETGSVNPSSF